MPALIGLPFKNGGMPGVGYYSIHTRAHCITPERTSNLIFWYRLFAVVKTLATWVLPRNRK